MSKSTLIRAWKDEEYRLSLSEAELALLPESPVGSLELTDAELDVVAGAGGFRLNVVVCGNTVNKCGKSINLGSCGSKGYANTSSFLCAVTATVGQVNVISLGGPG